MTETGRIEPVPAGYSRGAPIPWWAKIGLKLVLSRLPVPHSVWSRANIFKHSYAAGDSGKLIGRAREAVARFTQHAGRPPRSVLELGPGEMTTRAVAYAGLGIDQVIFVDVGDFGLTDVAAYKSAAALLAAQDITPPDLSGAADRAEVFRRCGVTYDTTGLAGLAAIPARSVDLVISEAVIEHIRLDELKPVIVELGRVIAPDGLGRHAIDFHDHLGCRLENLRFSRAVWEADWMARSGFYTNRVGASRVIAMLEQAGFDVHVLWQYAWDAPPIERTRMAADVQAAWTDADLVTCTVMLETILAPQAGTPRQRGPHAA
jgi:hypothetical protein